MKENAMTADKALEILVQIAHLAQKGGLLNLEEAVVAYQAIQVLNPNRQVASDKVESKE